jgi:hypothetical protein
VYACVVAFSGKVTRCKKKGQHCNESSCTWLGKCNKHSYFQLLAVMEHLACFGHENCHDGLSAVFRSTGPTNIDASPAQGSRCERSQIAMTPCTQIVMLGCVHDCSQVCPSSSRQPSFHSELLTRKLVHVPPTKNSHHEHFLALVVILTKNNSRPVAFQREGPFAPLLLVLQPVVCHSNKPADTHTHTPKPVTAT